MITNRAEVMVSSLKTMTDRRMVTNCDISLFGSVTEILHENCPKIEIRDKVTHSDTVSQKWQNASAE